MIIKQIKRIILASSLAMMAAVCFCACSEPNDMNGVDGMGVRNTVNSNDGSADDGMGDRDGNRLYDADGNLLGDMANSAGNAMSDVGNAVGGAVNGAVDGISDAMNGNEATSGSTTQNNGINAKPGGGNTTANR